MNPVKKPRKRQHRAYLIGIGLGLSGLTLLFSPGYEQFHVRGGL